MIGKKKFKTRAVIMRDSLDEMADVLEDVLNHFDGEGYEVDYHSVENKGALMGYLVVGRLRVEDTAEQVESVKTSILQHLEEIKKVHEHVRTMSPVEAKGLRLMETVLEKVMPSSADMLKRELPSLLNSMLGGQPATVLMELAEGLDSNVVKHASWHADPHCIVPEACKMIAAQLREMSKGSLS